MNFSVHGATNTKDEEFETKDEELQTRSYPAVRMLGREAYASTKAFSRLGSLKNDSLAMKNATDSLVDNHQKRMKEMLHESLLALPSLTQKDLPEAVRKQRLNVKAMNLCGDEDLNQKSLRVVTDTMKVKPKTLLLTGEIEIASPKVVKVLGSSEGDAQARQQADLAVAKPDSPRRDAKARIKSVKNALLFLRR